MVFGAIGKSNIQRVKETLSRIIGPDVWNDWIQTETDFFFLCFPHTDDATHRGHHLWVSDDGLEGLFWEGEIYNWAEFEKLYGALPKAQLLRTLQREGPHFLQQINGAFILFSWDTGNREVLMVRDRIGLRELFFQCQGEGTVFGSNLNKVAHLCEKSPELNTLTLLKYLVFCYNPGVDTFFQGVQRLRPGHLLKWKAGQVDLQRYWDVAFDRSISSDEDSIGAEIRDRLALAVKIRKEDTARTGTFLSGGLDSSSIVSLLHSMGKENLSTFSFRCRGESFDESHYAKIVADTFRTDHHLVEYGPEDILLASEMVELMEEPFCDVGINIATFLLSRAARGQVDELFTGDGGDELFAGHPVYEADKMAHLIHWIPGFILNPVFSLGRRLTDSDKKKDWKVKIKRFSKSYAFPEELRTHRWRAYYLPEELKELLNPDLVQNNHPDRVFEDVVKYNREGKDYNSLNQSLYSDYQTVVQYYLRRMDLARAMGIRPKFPMLDPDVISYCASIPSHLKIRGMSNTKYIEKKAVEPILPGEIVHRKDKLGHSIPLKNWMRENDKVRNFFRDLLSESTLRRRGFFNPNIVTDMMVNHMNKTDNNSHRLWALVILELWMQKVKVTL